MRYIRSKYEHGEMHFPPVIAADGHKLPGVVLPRSSYLGHEVAAGKRSVVAVSDAQHDRLMADDVFKSLLASGQYQFVDSMPEGQKTDVERLAEKDQRIADLEAELANKGKDAKPVKDAEAEQVVPPAEKDVLSVFDIGAEDAQKDDPAAQPAVSDPAGSEEE